jgi:hypothetical protein
MIVLNNYINRGSAGDTVSRPPGPTRTALSDPSPPLPPISLS